MPDKMHIYLFVVNLYCFKCLLIQSWEKFKIYKIKLYYTIFTWLKNWYTKNYFNSHLPIKTETKNFISRNKNNLKILVCKKALSTTKQ